VAHPQVKGGGNGLMIRRVAASILNKQSLISNKGWFSSLGLNRGRGITVIQHTIVIMLQNVSHSLGQIH
jgi:hypothetical protein